MSDPDTARDQIADLVDRFAANQEHYTAPQYNETLVRTQFVDPFFEALGWDIRDTRGRFDVNLEDYVKVEEGGRVIPKRPDYGFRIANQVRFFVETKKPSVNLKTNPEPAFQLRRYGWSAKLPVSILTDFEEFIIYDCRIQPNRDDGAQKGRLRYYTYQEYLDKWDEIAALFSYQAVLDNQLEAWANESKPRGTITVDDAFLSEMENWRARLAEDIALHNPTLTRRDLNMAVQTTIDRIVFLRIGEDRGIEPYGRLSDSARGARVYENLTQLFRQADAKYNSGLFHFKNEPGRDDPDTVTLGLTMSDDTLQHIVSRLYYPTSPYEFSVLPADILGQVYERFLGKVIEPTPGGGATVVEKPEVRKAGGVYYTPTYIVDYIVEHTVGQLLDGKNPDDVAALKILDPASGSGSFLIGAFQYLIDWHVRWYIEDGAAKHVRANRLRPLGNESVSPRPEGEGQGVRVAYTLTTAEKKRILLNNIHGVDLDQQAVEVTKLSLLLKVLEGETAASAQPELLAERVLPDLGDNIKWGNSLIGPDYYLGKQMALFDDEATYKVKVFDWHSPTDGFGAILAQGGFDAVIGNPPYIRIQTMTEWAAESVEFYKQRYVAASRGNYDIYVIFVEKALALLNANGRMGYILPHKFFNAQYGEPLRGLVAQGRHLSQVVHFGDQQVFDGATTYTCLLFLDKSGHEAFEFIKPYDIEQWRYTRQAAQGLIENMKVTAEDWNFSVGGGSSLLEKLRTLPVRLEDVTLRIFQGMKTSADRIYIVEERERSGNQVRIYSPQKDAEYWLEVDLLHPLIKGGDSKRYSLSRSNRLLLFPYVKNHNEQVSLISETDLQTKYPFTWTYLTENKGYLENRENGRMIGSKWYGYIYPKALDVMSLPKIFTPDIAPVSSFSLDETGDVFFTGGTAGGYGILVRPEYSRAYILGLLNSKLLEWFIHQTATSMRGGWFSYESRFIKHLPIRTIDFDDPADKRRHDRMVELVSTMLDLHQQRAAAASPQFANTIQSVIDQTDRAIDALVYDLYGLTDDEIAVVEGA